MILRNLILLGAITILAVIANDRQCVMLELIQKYLDLGCHIFNVLQNYSTKDEKSQMWQNVNVC